MKHFKFYNRKDILSLTRLRKFETKLGERLASMPPGAEWPEGLAASPAKYVLVGIPEDIGVKANFGTGGTDTNWYPFLHSFLNIQSNDFLTGEDILLLGHFDFGDLKYLIENNAYNPEEMVDANRHAVNIIDEEVEHMIKIITAAKKIPIVVGGGHNNAYPIIKGAAKGLQRGFDAAIPQINCINLDAHTDYRTMEGRHSGNAFRYAEADGFLGKYALPAIHENYIPQSVLSDINENHFIRFTSFEDIFIREKISFSDSVKQASAFTSDNFCGVELDTDCIEHALTSARTPCGLNVLHARQYLHFTAKNLKVAYLHISEAASQLADGSKDECTGKLISYLVSDFVKSNSAL